MSRKYVLTAMNVNSDDTQCWRVGRSGDEVTCAAYAWN